MTQYERGGGRRNSPGKGRRPEKRTPPPEATGELERFYQELIASEQSVVLHLDDGRTVDGRLGETAPGSVQVVNDSGSEEWIQLAQIRYLTSES